MKHTYIFEVADGVTEGDLGRLAAVLKCRTVSYKTSHSHCRYDRIQVFTVPGEMHWIAHLAGFSGEQLCVALPAARRRGWMAVSRANERLDNLRRNTAEEFTDTQRLDWLQKTNALVNTPNTSDGLAHIHLDGLNAPHFYDRTYRDVIDRAMRAELGEEACKRAMHRPFQMPGGTKRSKRSA